MYIFASSHCNPFEDRVPIDEIYVYPFFKCVAETWQHERAPSHLPPTALPPDLWLPSEGYKSEKFNGFLQTSLVGGNSELFWWYIYSQKNDRSVVAELKENGKLSSTQKVRRRLKSPAVNSGLFSISTSQGNIPPSLDLPTRHSGSWWYMSRVSRSCYRR